MSLLEDKNASLIQATIGASPGFQLFFGSGPSVVSSLNQHFTQEAAICATNRNPEAIDLIRIFSESMSP